MDIVPVIVTNVERLMAARGWSQLELSKRSGVAQNTISRLLDYERLGRVPSVTTVAALARGFGIPAWQLQIPDLPVDVLGSQRLAALVGNYVAANPEGRASLERVAEAEARIGTMAGERAGSRSRRAR